MSKSETTARWSVREEGNLVIVEFTLRDNYEAILLCEVIADGMRDGYLEIKFENEAAKRAMERR